MKKLITYAMFALIGAIKLVGQCHGMSTASNDESLDVQLLQAAGDGDLKK